KEEAITAYHNGHVHLHTRVAVQASSLNNQTFTEEQNSKLLVTTVGKLLFNEIIPTTFPYMNEPTINKLEEETPNGYFLEMGEDIVKNIKARQIVSPFKKGILSDIISEVFNKYKFSETSKMLDCMKDLGLYYYSRSGFNISVLDIINVS